MKNSPFKFLDSYSREDRKIFFGRDKEIEELYSRVFQSRILVVYGVSGTGKSSLINCGLANKFNDSDWLPVSIRRGFNINRSLIDSLLKSALSDPAKNANNPIKLIRSVYLDHFKPVFLIFDQFEEVFIFGTKAERDEFISTLKKIIDSDLQCRFIFSMREEYLAGFTEFEKVIPSFLDNRIRIEKMTRQNAIRAIEGPCEVYGIAVEEGLPGKIVEKLNPDSPEVELTYFQVYLDKLFRFAAEEEEDVKIINGSHSDKVGDVKDLLGAFLEEQISQLDDPATGLVILKSFVSVKGTKHQVTEQDVVEYSRTLGMDIDISVVRDMIQKFIRLRILRDKDEHSRYELRHDSLASAIYEKITLVEKELLEVRQFIESSFNNFERRELYLTAADLEYIAPYEDKLFLGEKLSKFISQSKRIIHKAKRRRQNVMIVTAAVLFAILSFFSLWAMRERRNALAQQKIAEERRSAAVVAMSAADSARKDAIVSKDMAIKNEQLAITAQMQSETARREALVQREAALVQKSLAEKLSVQANEQAKIATEQRILAEQERKKAEDAGATAERLGRLATAQNLALTSLSVEKDPVQKGALSLKAYTYNVENKGYINDPVIFEALSDAWLKLDSSRHSIFQKPENEIWSIGNLPDLVTADLEGNLIRWNEMGEITAKSVISYNSPVSFIRLSNSAQYVITQHDDLEVFVSKCDPGLNIIELKRITTAKDNLRCVAFSPREDILALAFNDSSTIILNLPGGETVNFRNREEVTCLAFDNAGNLYTGCTSGKIYLRNQAGGEIKEVLSAEMIPLSLLWNEHEHSLFAGFTDGSITVARVIDGAPLSKKEYNVHSSGTELMSFSDDFSLFATAGRDKTIRLYFYDEFFRNGNMAGGTVLLRDLTGRIRSLTFTPGKKLAAGLSGNEIRIWETSPERLASDIKNILGDQQISERVSGTTVMP